MTSTVKTRTRAGAKHAGLAFGLVAGVVAPSAAQVVTAATASAATVTATNVSVTTDVADGSVATVGVTRFHITDSWNVPTGTAQGDTSTITFPRNIDGAALDGAEITSPDGQVIGTISGKGESYTVTYTDYAKTHQNVKASVTFAVGVQNYSDDTQDELIPVGSTVDGTEQTPAHVKLEWAVGGEQDYPVSSWAGTNTFDEIPGSRRPGIVGRVGFPRIDNDSDVGQTLTGTIKIGDKPDGTKPDGGNQTFDCTTALSNNTQLMYYADNVTSDYYQTDTGVSYRNNPDNKYSNTYDTNSDNNPFQVKITGCTDDTLTFTWVPKAVGDVLTMTTRTQVQNVGWLAPYTIVNLDPQAVANQYSGMYYADGDDGASTHSTASTFGYYTFDSRSGSGNAYPTAVDDTATTPYNTPVTTDVSANDKESALDTKLDPTSVAVQQADGSYAKTPVTTADGTWTPDGKGGITFAPKAGFTGTTTISYQIADVAGLTSTANYTVTVGSAANPTAAPDSATTPFNTPVNLPVLSNDTLNQPGATWSKVQLQDAQGNPVNTLTTAEGTWTVNSDNTVNFAPKSGYTGTTQPVTYIATDSDDKNATSTAVVTVTVAAAPSAVDDTFTTKFNTPVTIHPLTNDKLNEPGATWKSVVLDGAGADGSVKTDQGTFTMSGNDVVFTPAAGFSGAVPAIGYTATDSNGRTAKANISGTVGDAAAPKATNDTFTTPFNTPVTTDVLANDTLGEPGSSWKTVTLDGAGADGSVKTDQGTFTVVDNKVVFTPANGFSGAVPAIGYTATDSNGKTAKATVGGTVGDASSPNAVNDTFTTPFGTPVTTNVLANDKLTQDGATWKSVTLDGAGADGSVKTDQGTFTVADNNVVFTPAAGFSGNVPAIGYTATDSNGKTAKATVGGTVGAPTAPTATDDSFATPFNTPVTTDVLANDVLTQNGATWKSVTLDGAGADGSVTTDQGVFTVVDNKVVFTPVTGFSGDVPSIGYTATDSNGQTAKAKVSGKVGDAKSPTAADDTFNTPFNTPVTTDVTANDALTQDGSSWKSVTLDGAGADGSLKTDQGVFTVDGLKVVFTPATGFSGNVPAVGYIVTDSNGKTAQAKVSGVVGDASAPTAENDTFNTPFGTPVTTDVLANDKLTQDGASWKSVTLDGAGADGSVKTDQGTFTVTDNKVVFTPAAGFHGDVPAIGYTATDSNGKTAKATVGGTVGKANAPTATDDTFTTPFNTPVTTDVLANDKLTQDGATWKSVTLDGAGTDGSVKTDQGTFTVVDNKVVFTPVTGFSGKVPAIGYTATDSNGKTAKATVGGTVGDANSPTAADDTFTTPFGTPVTIDALANDKLTQDGATWKSITLDGADKDGVLKTDQGTFKVVDNKVVFTPAAGFSGNVPAISYTATDSNGKTVQAKISGVVGDAKAPTATDDHASTPFGTPVTVDVLSNDTLGQDGSSWKTVQLVGTDGKPTDTLKTDQGTFTVTDNKVTFTPAKGFSGEVPAVSYIATDSNGKTATAKVTITVAGAESPAAADDTATTKENTPVTIDVTKNDTPSKSGGTFTSVKLVGDDGKPTDKVTTKDGTFTVDGLKVIFTPAKGFSGDVPAIKYIVTDSNGKTATASIHVKVTKVADKPTPVTPKPKPVTPKPKPVTPKPHPVIQTDYVRSGSTGATDTSSVLAMVGLLGAAGTLTVRKVRKNNG